MPNKPSSLAPQVLHLVGPGSLRVDNGRLAWKPLEGSVQRLASETLQLVQCYGSVTVTDKAMQKLLKANVEVAWLTKGGRICRGRVTNPQTSSTSLRMLQHAALTRSFRLELSRQLVTEKIESQQHAFRHYQRHRNLPAGTARSLSQAITNAATCPSIDQLRGIEGLGFLKALG